MADITTVMSWLDGLAQDDWRMFHSDSEVQEIAKAALTLLKEQEAVEPYGMNAERTYGICPKCGKIVFRYGNIEENHYCGVCGKKVKWDAYD